MPSGCATCYAIYVTSKLTETIILMLKIFLDYYVTGGLSRITKSFLASITNENKIEKSNCCIICSSSPQNHEYVSPKLQIKLILYYFFQNYSMNLE